MKINILLSIFMITDLIIPFIIAIPYKGYSHTKNVMSVLGCKKSPWGTIYNIWMIISGICISLVGYIIFRYYGDNINLSLSISLFILILLYSLGDEVISGIFPLNENKEDLTLSSKIHGIGSVIGFIALQFSPIPLGILELKSNEVPISIISFIFFALSFISFIFFIMGDKPKFKNTILSLEGLWQRLICLLLYMPFIIWLLYHIH